MKHIKSLKLWGIILALAILAGLAGTAAAPVSAGELSWTPVNLPPTHDFQFTEGTSANIMAVTPNGAAVFVFSNNNYAVNASNLDTQDLKLYKSVDGGLTWTTDNLGAGLEATAEVPAMNINRLAASYDYASDQTLYAVAGEKIYRSQNGGASFSEWSDYAAIAADIGTVKSIDTAESYLHAGNGAVLVAGENGIALYNEFDNTFDIISDAEGFFGETVLGAAFSPGYTTDTEIMAVTCGEYEYYGEDYEGCLLETRFGNNNWNSRVRISMFLDTYWEEPIEDATTAVFAFPGDYSYSSNNKVYVGLGNPDWGLYDVYRVEGTTTISQYPKKAINLALSDWDSDCNIFSLAYRGTASSGILVVSFNNTDAIYYTTDVLSSSPDWMEPAIPFTGENIALVLAGNTFYAGTACEREYDYGNYVSSDFGGVFASSLDGIRFTGLSLISVPDLGSVTISRYLPAQNAPNQWVIYNVPVNESDHPYVITYQMFFKSTDAGQTWKDIYLYRQGTIQIDVNNIIFAGADTIYLQEISSTAPWMYSTYPRRFKKSIDGGYTWQDYVANLDYTGSVSSLCVSGEDIWTGSTAGGLYKYPSFIQVADLDGKVPFVMIPLPGFFIICTLADGGDAPGPGDVYVSTDGGNHFERLGDPDQFRGLFSFTLDAANQTIYAANKAGDNDQTIYQWKVGTSTAWEEIADLSALPGFTHVISGLTLAGDGTLYLSARNSDTSEGDPEQIWRCVSFHGDCRAEDFQAIEGSTFNDFGGQISPGPLTVVSAGGNTLFPVVALSDSSDSSSGLGSAVLSFTDTLTAPVVTTSPKANAQTAPMVTVAWQAVPSVKTIHYQWQVATDSQFQNIAQESGGGVDGTTATSAIVEGLTFGQQYYFRVRVSDPLYSDWSTVVPFTVRLEGYYIATDSLPDGHAKAGYSQILTVVGDNSPYKWTIKKGMKLPSGLTLKANKPDTSTATVSGKPATAGEFTFTVQVADNTKVVTEKTFSVFIYPELSLSIPPQPLIEMNAECRPWAAFASGGNGEYQWSGSLPPGLEINADTGRINGTLTTSGTLPVTLTVQDTAGGTTTKTTNLKVLAPMSITATILPAADIGVAYQSVTLKAAGGAGKYAWSVADGSLPPGLTLSLAGSIGGTPLPGSSGEYEFIVRASDGIGTATQNFGITINGPLTVSPLPDGVAGQDYSQALSATGGSGGYKYSAVGVLPAWLKLDSKTGTLSGTPSSAGTYRFVIKITDSLKATAVQVMEITISD